MILDYIQPLDKALHKKLTKSQVAALEKKYAIFVYTFCYMDWIKQMRWLWFTSSQAATVKQRIENNYTNPYRFAWDFGTSETISQVKNRYHPFQYVGNFSEPLTWYDYLLHTHIAQNYNTVQDIYDKLKKAHEYKLQKESTQTEQKAIDSEG